MFREYRIGSEYYVLANEDNYPPLYVISVDSLRVVGWDFKAQSLLQLEKSIVAFGNWF